MPIRNEKPSVDAIADDPISVTVDATDLTANSADHLKSIINRYGRPVSARAFADFQQPILADLAVHLYQMGFTLVHCPSWPNGDGFPKTIVSDVIAQDLRDQLEQLDGVRTYLLVATSRDFIAVANALKRHEIQVVVVAEDAKVCRELRSCADEYVVLPPTRQETSRYGRVSQVAERFAERPAAAAAEPAPVERPVESRVERTSPAPRTRRSADTLRAERAAESSRAERVEAPRVERAEPIRTERSESPRVERADPQRLEKAESPRTERAETSRAERVDTARVERADGPEFTRLPADGEVLHEVRRIVAAEGICTPRRLARALCPVDRTPTGELRSRIANRIQALIDAGKLQRERLVVGGTSVETILVRDERPERDAQPAQAETLVQPTEASVTEDSGESEPRDAVEPALVLSPERMELGPELPLEVVEAEAEAMGSGGSPVKDLDAFVESMLRSTEGTAPGEIGGEQAKAPSPEDAPEPAPAPPEPVKRSRSRRRPTPKPAVPEANGAA